MCPSCPLSFVEQYNFEAVAHWLALESAIYRAQETLDASHWLTKWAPVVHSLSSLLKGVPRPVMDKARTVRVPLPSVG
jgi:hypothetical protein